MPTQSKRKPKHEPLDEAQCLDCYFYTEDLPPAELPPDTGFCMRYPPSKDYVTQQGQDVSRPRVTRADWWCGEFKRDPHCD